MNPPHHPDPGRVGQRGTRLAWLLVVLAGSFSIAASLWQRPNIDTDMGTCLLAAEQQRVGRSDRFHQLVDVDPGDLSRDRIQEITWWPPSYTIPAVLGKLAGIDWGRSLQFSFLFFWSIGILGWALLFRRLASGHVLPWLLLSLILFRYCHHSGYLYEGGELMYWSLFPGIMLLNLLALEQRDGGRWLVILAGLATPCLVLLKYSAGISVLGIGSCWLLMARTRQTSLPNLGCWTAAAVVASAAILLGGQLPQGNPATSSGDWQWAALLWAPGAWTFAMSDLESLVRYLAVQPGRDILPGIGGGIQGGQIALVSPVTLGVVAWLLICSRRLRPPGATGDDVLPSRRLAETVVVVHLMVFTLVLTALVLAGGAIHMDARLLRPASLAVLPLLIMRAVRVVQSGDKMARYSGVTFLLVLVVLPATYGAATLVDKSLFRSRSAASKTGPLGIRHDLLGVDGNAKKFYKEIRQAIREGGEGSVLYIIDPGMALPLADQRLLIEHAHLRTVEHLEKKRYTGCPPGGVFLVLPGEFAANGKLAVIENSFQDVDWQPIPLDSQPAWILKRGIPRITRDHPAGEEARPAVPP